MKFMRTTELSQVEVIEGVTILSFLSFPQPSCIFIVSTASETGKDKRRQFCVLAFICLDGKFLMLFTEVPRLFVKCIHFLPIPQK